jgi:hypothetical protein
VLPDKPTAPFCVDMDQLKARPNGGMNDNVDVEFLSSDLMNDLKTHHVWNARSRKKVLSKPPADQTQTD